VSVFQDLFYEPFTPRVRKALGAHIVTRSGIIFKGPKWSFFSTYNNPIVKLRFLIISFLSILKRGAVYVDGSNLGVIHSGWTAGYYHWITESLPRALLMKDMYPDAVPILPSERYSNYLKSLECLGFRCVEKFPTDRNVVILDPILTECPRSFGTTAPALLHRVRDLVVEHFSCDMVCNNAKIVYVSRRQARGRYILNEKEVIENLRSFGAEVVCFEDLCFQEQVHLMMDTRILVSIHGAALTNMMFMNAGSKIVEIIPHKNGIFDYNIVRNSFKHDPCYVRLAEVMGHDYNFLECTPDNGRYSHTHMANLTVNIDRLNCLMGKILKDE